MGQLECQTSVISYLHPHSFCKQMVEQDGKSYGYEQSDTQRNSTDKISCTLSDPESDLQVFVAMNVAKNCNIFAVTTQKHSSKVLQGAIQIDTLH